MAEHNEGLPYEEEYTKRVSARWQAVFILGLILSNLMFGALFAWQFVKKTQIEYVMVQFDEADNMVYRIQQSSHLSADKAELLRESMLRRYVVDRLTVNHIDEEVRYKRVKLMSSEKIWTEFNSQMNPDTNPNSPLGNATYQSKIRILRPPTQITKQGYQIDFEQIEVKRGVELPPTRWSAYIVFSYVPLNIEFKDRYLNIDGITVERFSIRQEF